MLSVLIAAGPAAGPVIDQARRTRAKRIDVFEPIRDSNPKQIIEQLRTIAREGETDHLIIQCEADRPIMAYASLFADPSAALTNVSHLTSVAFAIDAATILDSFLDRKATPVSPCFLAEQLEFVTDIFLDGSVDSPELQLARAIIATLNPRARLLSLDEDSIAKWRDRRTAAFDFEKAFNDAAWRKLLDGEMFSSGGGDEIIALAYHARRPFHPERFWVLLQNGLPGLFRAKGFFWLATRMEEVGGLNLAGAELQCASAGRWWAARDSHVRNSEMPERTRNEWREPFGDRRQSLAVMALGNDRETLQRQLDGCLLTDDEMAGGADSWCSFTDPFPSWSAHAHPHEHDQQCHHDDEHGSHKHGCCGH
jgi:G3E family GTPase